MDPPALMNDGSFPSGRANGSSYNLAEILQFPMNGDGESGGQLGLRMAHFGLILGQFGDVSPANQQVMGDDSVSLKQRVAHGGAKKRRDGEDEAFKGVSNNNSQNDCDLKRPKTAASGDENKTESEPSSGKPIEQNSNHRPEPPKQDYIHVRARRGQATDSHSLAERARREKISERMKILQDLVPGCNKVIGKALVLDEIINYVQSLQRQVEFLSMKLEVVNSRMSTGIEVFPSKDFGQQTFDTAGMTFGSQPTNSRGSSPEWLHMQVGGGFERTT